ncbi:hypothetical protein NDU88_006065 [Pleurodeles waltl]|uniref:Uncharacterized protein n=1 Tax=Pleurodeles waltl TaxID=8319 RepID=A0AAV7QMJ4_PLEWA|nr:hypothetical protein NDU88_006065 [Pleurodeles waltl]
MPTHTTQHHKQMSGHSDGRPKCAHRNTHLGEVQQYHGELAKGDRTKKAKMKEYADRRQRAQLSTVQEGDWVLIRQEQKRKLDSLYHEHPLQVTNRKGTMVMAVSDDKRVTQNITHFRKCNPSPKEALSGVDSDVTEDASTPVMRS